MGTTMEMVEIPAGYALRPPVESDISAILALLAAHDIAQSGFADAWTEEDIQQEWGRLDVRRDAWVIVAPDGSLAAYARLQDEGSGHLEADGYVHPEHWDRGLGTALVRLTEQRARELVPGAPEGVRVALSNNVVANAAAANELLVALGYHLVRGFWRMGIELADEPEAPTWLEGITLCAFERGRDERRVFDCVEEAFADHWGHVPHPFEEWIARTDRSDFDPSLWLLAEEGNQLAGVALCRRRPDGGWVNSLAVRRPWRRRGLGEVLLRQAFRELYLRGERSVGLGVDAQSLTGATRLYERAGMRVTLQIASYEKELRPGVDLSTQTLGE
ncbi:MAG TPA: GNAT family N-acetyltransferase [Ktedonobacterales bacterium]